MTEVAHIVVAALIALCVVALPFCVVLSRTETARDGE